MGIDMQHLEEPTYLSAEEAEDRQRGVKGGGRL